MDFIAYQRSLWIWHITSSITTLCLINFKYAAFLNLVIRQWPNPRPSTSLDNLLVSHTNTQGSLPLTHCVTFIMVFLMHAYVKTKHVSCTSLLSRACKRFQVIFINYINSGVTHRRLKYIQHFQSSKSQYKCVVQVL